MKYFRGDEVAKPIPHATAETKTADASQSGTTKKSGL
jgi:hypothetical protein